MTPQRDQVLGGRPSRAAIRMGTQADRQTQSSWDGLCEGEPKTSHRQNPNFRRIKGQPKDQAELQTMQPPMSKARVLTKPGPENAQRSKSRTDPGLAPPARARANPTSTGKLGFSRGNLTEEPAYCELPRRLILPQPPFSKRAEGVDLTQF